MSGISPEDPARALAEWRVAHPLATLADIEQAVDAHLRAYRSDLIEQTAQSVGGLERPTCAECGHALQQVGQRSRTLRTAHDGRLRLTDTAWRCPVCGTGVFPPD